MNSFQSAFLLTIVVLSTWPSVEVVSSVRVCGPLLTRLLHTLCDHRIAKPMTLKQRGVSIRIAEECCEHSCSYQYLMAFCERDTNSVPDAIVKRSVGHSDGELSLFEAAFAEITGENAELTSTMESVARPIRHKHRVHRLHYETE